MTKKVMSRAADRTTAALVGAAPSGTPSMPRATVSTRWDSGLLSWVRLTRPAPSSSLVSQSLTSARLLLGLN